MCKYSVHPSIINFFYVCTFLHLWRIKVFSFDTVSDASLTLDVADAPKAHTHTYTSHTHTRGGWSFDGRRQTTLGPSCFRHWLPRRQASISEWCGVDVPAGHLCRAAASILTTASAAAAVAAADIERRHAFVARSYCTRDAAAGVALPLTRVSDVVFCSLDC